MPALRKTGLHIVYRQGSTPAGTVWTLYGTAENAHHFRINFGILLTGNTAGEVYPEERFMKFVPHATVEGSTSGQSFLVITSMGYGAGGSERVISEESNIFDELFFTVKKLAPAAAREASG